MLIRRERQGDEPAVRVIQALAFQRPGDASEPPETALLDNLRASREWIPALSIVAVDDERIVGHVVCTRAIIEPATQVLGLGPIGVHPDRQAAGIGTALVHTVLGAADALDEPLVALLGSPAYYSRFGFVLATEVGVEAPPGLPTQHFQVRTLAAYDPAITGQFRYASPFDEL